MPKEKEDKILQIIPAPPGLVILHSSEDGEAWTMPVMCLALVENNRGERSIEPKCLDPELGLVSDDMGYFVGYRLVQEPPILDEWKKEAKEWLERASAKKDSQR